MKGKTTANTDLAPREEVTVEKEAEAAVPAEVPLVKDAGATLPPAPPPSSTEVLESTVEMEAEAAMWMRVGVRVKLASVRIGFGLMLRFCLRLGFGFVC